MELSERDNPIKSRSFVIPAVENKDDASKSIPSTEVVISIFSNTVSVLITQTNKIGCMVIYFLRSWNAIKRSIWEEGKMKNNSV